MGDDGVVYEGRGYKFRGEIPGKNSSRSLGFVVALIGTFEVVQPSKNQMATFNHFLENSVHLQVLRKNYTILVQDQLVKGGKLPKGLQEVLIEIPEFHLSKNFFYI